VSRYTVTILDESIFTHNVNGSHVEDPTPLFEVVARARARLQAALIDATGTGGEFPEQDADAMSKVIGWQQGFGEICDPSSGPVQWIKYTINQEHLGLLPELMPIAPELVPAPGGARRVAWLDQLAPSWRSVRQKDRLPHGSPGPVSNLKRIAIIYQTGDPLIHFEDWARRVCNDLLETGLEVSTYPGACLVDNDELLYEAFREHEAVLFFGHDDREDPGWRLTPSDTLTLSKMERYLARHAPGVRGQSRAASSPGGLEIVFGGCCSSPDDPATYPVFFLNNNVRFVVSAWMKVWGQNGQMLGDVIVPLATNFFRRCAESPAAAVAHLWSAKRDLAFDLVTSFFHIYTPPLVEQPEIDLGSRAEKLESEGSTRDLARPPSPQQSTLGKLGKYSLVSELWNTSHSRTWFATVAGAKQPVWVQVLSDDWPVELHSRLERALGELRGLKLSDGHLIPSRAEVCQIEAGSRAVLVLVYDRPAGDVAEGWTTLRAAASAERTGDYSFSLRVGSEIGRLIVELHKDGLAHGSLDSDAVVFSNRADAQDPGIFLKDLWLYKAGARRWNEASYDAPDEHEHPIKADVWGLGAILFCLTTGYAPVVEGGITAGSRSIREHLSTRGAGVPEALERVVLECLMPSANLRPAAEQVERRLRNAQRFAGRYVDPFEEALHHQMEAGRRLFAVAVESRRDIEPVLDRLHRRGRQIVIVKEDRGAIAYPSGQLVDLWPVDENRPVPAERVASDFLRKLVGHFAGTPVLIVLWGSSWWQSGSVAQQLSANRLLLDAQDGCVGPALLVVDSEIGLHHPEQFHKLFLPPLAPAELVECLLAPGRSMQLPLPEGVQSLEPLAEEQAVHLAGMLHPCARRELLNALRLCAARYGVLDERLLEARQDEHESTLRQLSGIAYTPPSQLPVRALGLTQQLQEAVSRWCEAFEARNERGTEELVPRRLLISGGAGYGKLQLAYAIASRLGLPLVKVDVAGSLRGFVGDSERTLVSTLGALRQLPRALVLFSNPDARLARPEAAALPALERMQGIWLRWLDELPSHLVAVTTSAALTLPPAWQRRVQLEFALSHPYGISEPSPESKAYRTAVFRAVFANHRLLENEALMRDLAERTQGIPVHNPFDFAHDRAASMPRGFELRSPADIENWVQEHIRLAAAGCQFNEEFWLAKLEAPRWHA
jgi:hypothetical protein